MGNRLVFYISFSFPGIWKPHFELFRGESFCGVVEADNTVTPLDKQYGFEFTWLLIHVSVTLNLDL